MSTGPVDPEDIAALVRRKMLLCAFHHWIGTDCDSRIGALLLKAGVLKRDIALPDIPGSLIAALRNPDCDEKVPLEHGPVILVKVTDSEKAAAIVSAVELLCAFDRDARDASLAHLEREPSALTPLSQRVIAEYAEDIRATDVDRWLPAAMRAERVLASDFKLTLAGFRIGGHLRNQELQEHCWSHLVQPSLESLLSVHDDGYRFVTSASAGRNAITELTNNTGSVLEALSRYDEALGHLPVHASLDIGSALKVWLEGRTTPDLWGALREWRASSAHPLRALQACIVALANQASLPPAAREWLQGTVRGLVSPRDINPAERLNEAILRLEADFARYYFRYVELRVPGFDVNRVATVSWWAARRLTDVIAHQAASTLKPSEFVSRVHKRALRPMLQRSELEWHAGHPRSGHASVRFGTTFCRQPRLLALLIRLSGAVDSIAPEGLSREDADAITGAFVEHQIGCFPIESAASESAVWAFDAPLAPAFAEWIAAAAPPEDHEKLLQLVALGTAAADTQRLTDELEGIAKAPESTRRFLAHLFRVAAYCRSDAAEQLWRLAMSPAWREVCFKELPLEAVEALFDGIVEVSRRVSDDRVLELPHIFAQRHEDRESGEERRSWFFALTLLAATAVGRVSAVRRIVNVPNRDRDLSSIERWGEQIREMLPLSSPILQGTLRDVLSSLTPA